MKYSERNTFTLLICLLLSAGACPWASGQTSAAEQAAMTPQAVLADLLAGNARYVQGELSPPEIQKRVAVTAKGQYPKAVILSCLDSRVPVEWIFDQGIGDIFVGRVAGNIENTDQLGSMEFAAKLAGSKLVMVLGHTACGAVKGACDGAKLGNLTDLLEEIQPAVKAVKGHDAKGRNSKNLEFVNAVVVENVHQTIADIRKESKVLADMEARGEILLVGALYDLQTGKVQVLD